MACGLWVAERSSRPRTTAGRPHANRPRRDCSSSGNVPRFAGKPSLRGALVRAERYRRRRHARELQHANPGNVPARGGSPATAASVIRTRAGKGTRPASGRTRRAASVPPTRACTHKSAFLIDVRLRSESDRGAALPRIDGMMCHIGNSKTSQPHYSRSTSRKGAPRSHEVASHLETE